MQATITQAQMLAPAAALVVWSLFMLLWMTRSRFSAMAEAGFDLSRSRPGGRGQDLQGKLPDPVMWKSHNYTHLMEQPTLFYAVVVILALVAPDRGNALLAWAYVLLRVIHSIYQATVNRVKVRLTIFAVSTLVLIALALRALAATLVG